MSLTEDLEFAFICTDCECIKETDLAILVAIGGREVWFPKSVIKDASEVYKDGTKGELVAESWFAEKEGLI